MRQVHEWLENILEDQLVFAENFSAKIAQSEKEMSAGLRPRLR
jgi:GR25 family glycosyltransferase involved in LPS biosynthesis